MSIIATRCNSRSSYDYTRNSYDPEMLEQIRQYQENPQDYIVPGVPRPPENPPASPSDSTTFQP